MNIFALFLFLALAIFGSFMTFHAYKKKNNVVIFIINALISFTVAFLPANAEFKLISIPFLDSIKYQNWIFFGLFALLFIANIILYNRRRKIWGKKNLIKNTLIGKNNTANQTTVVTEGKNVNININDRIQPAFSEKVDSGESNNGYIGLEETYTSIYAEENELRSEIIKLKHDKKTDKVTGEVSSLDGSMRFTLEGEFIDLILTGQYKATQGKKPERGSINLRMVDDFLTGFCSFSTATKEKDPIRVSPYVWVPGSKKDLLNGTYDFCTECHKEGTFCCCASDTIDEPLLLPTDTIKIVNCLKRKEENTNVTPYSFSDAIKHSKATLQIRKMKRTKSEKNNCSPSCYFYDTSHKGCKIYDDRPIDCRLFPFDIILNPKNSELHVGYYQHLCERPLPNRPEMEKYAHVLRPYLFLFYPYAHTTSLKTVSPKLYKEMTKDDGFVDLGTLRDFLF